MKFAHLTNKSLLKVYGKDSYNFINGLTTQNVFKLEQQKSIYSAFLSPVGRVLYDVFIYSTRGTSLHSSDDELLIECDKNCVDGLQTHIKKYILRSKVQFEQTQLQSYQLLDNKNMNLKSLIKDGMIIDDPRTLLMGQKLVCSESDGKVLSLNYDQIDITKERFKMGIPEGSQDFIPETFFAQESNLDLLNALDYKKGCYIGQENTIRTHHRGVVRKRIFPVLLQNSFNQRSNTEFDIKQLSDIYLKQQQDCKSKSQGKLISTHLNYGLALMRLDSVKDLLDGSIDQSENLFYVEDSNNQTVDLRVNSSSIMNILNNK